MEKVLYSKITIVKLQPTTLPTIKNSSQSFFVDFVNGCRVLYYGVLIAYMSYMNSIKHAFYYFTLYSIASSQIS